MSISTEVSVALISGATGLLGIGLKAYFDYRKTQKELALWKAKDTSSSPPLSMHSLFNRLEVNLQQVHNSFCIENKGKEAVFKCLLDNNLQIYKRNLYDLANTLDSKLSKDVELSGADLYDLFSSIENKCLSEFSQFYKNTSFSEDEQKSLDIVMRKFNQWHQPRMDYLTDSLYTICCASLFYKDAYAKSVAIFDIYQVTFSDTLRDAQSSLNAINGDLKGLVFNGYIL